MDECRISKQVYDEICHNIRNLTAGARLINKFIDRIEKLETILDDLIPENDMKYSEKQFIEDLKIFESQVICKGIDKQKIDVNMIMIPTRDCKLTRSKFGAILGIPFTFSTPCAIDYYGFIKKSSGFYKRIHEFPEFQIKSFKVPVIHFASIKIEQVKSISPDFESSFRNFKKYLLSIRGF